MRNTFMLVAAVVALAMVSSSTATAADEKLKPEVVEGFVHSVDAKAKSFVLGGRNESTTTFRVAVEAEGNREAAHVLLDGERSTFDAAIQKGRKASVTFVKTGAGELWVWKVAVTSAAK